MAITGMQTHPAGHMNFTLILSPVNLHASTDSNTDFSVKMPSTTFCLHFVSSKAKLERSRSTVVAYFRLFIRRFLVSNKPSRQQLFRIGSRWTKQCEFHQFWNEMMEKVIRLLCIESHKYTMATCAPQYKTGEHNWTTKNHIIVYIAYPCKLRETWTLHSKRLIAPYDFDIFDLPLFLPRPCQRKCIHFQHTIMTETQRECSIVNGIGTAEMGSVGGIWLSRTKLELQLAIEGAFDGRNHFDIVPFTAVEPLCKPTWPLCPSVGRLGGKVLAHLWLASISISQNNDKK